MSFVALIFLFVLAEWCMVVPSLEIKKKMIEQVFFNFLQHRSGQKHRTIRALPLTNPLIQLKRST
jgi:hypothetical protein